MCLSQFIEHWTVSSSFIKQTTTYSTSLWGWMNIMECPRMCSEDNWTQIFSTRWSDRKWFWLRLPSVQSWASEANTSLAAEALGKYALRSNLYKILQHQMWCLSRGAYISANFSTTFYYPFLSAQLTSSPESYFSLILINLSGAKDKNLLQTRYLRQTHFD